MVDCKPIQTPMTISQVSNSEGAPHLDYTQYHSIVGVFQYVTLICLDISFAVNKVYQFMQSSSADHWVMVKQILRYLKATTDYGLQISRSIFHSLQAFFDADWAGSGTDQRSTRSYAIFLGPNLIFWAFRK